MNKKRYLSIDCVKGIACIATVIIHYNISGGSIPESVGLAMKTVCRFAVPVFFCVSGFFLSSSAEIDSSKTIQKTLHIMKLLLGSALFYACYTYIYCSIDNIHWDISAYISEKITATKLIKLFLTHDPFVYSHLWFLIALIFCYLFVLLFINNSNRKIIYYLAPLCLIAYNCMHEFRILPTSITLPEMSSNIVLYNSFIFRALPAFLSGMILRNHCDKIAALKIPNTLLYSLAVFGCILSLIERNIFFEAQFYFGSYITWLSLMLWAIRNPSNGNSALIHVGRDLSMYVYILHIAVGKVIDFLGGKLHFWGHTPYYIARPFVVLILSLLVAECVFAAKRIVVKHTQAC